MLDFEKILVILEYNNYELSALDRAVTLASKRKEKNLNTEISIVLIHPDNVNEDEAENSLAGMLANRELDITNSLYINEKKSLDYLLNYTETENTSLLIKFVVQNDSLMSILVTPFDWQLLRKCVCPIMLVKSKEWLDNGKILVAVNVSDSEEYHEEFNDKLVTLGISLSNTLDYDLVELVNAYPTIPVNISIDLPEFNPVSYSENVRDSHLLNMKKLRQKFSIGDEHTHVFEGSPEEVIPSVAEKISANIVVLGTIGRSGLSAVFLGNTTEQLIEHLNCDLLAIKPDIHE